MTLPTKPRIIIITVLFIFFGEKISAQLSNSLYFMDRIPQSNILNPATQPLSNFYLGIPCTNIELNAGNSAVGFSDIFIFGVVKDSLVYPNHNEKTKTDFLAKLKETSYIYTDNRVDILSMGIRIHDSYFSFNISERFEAYGYLPKDLIKFGLNFNGSGLSDESFNISDLGFKAQWFREFGIGLSQQINPKFNFGIRAKFLLGIASFTTSNSTIELNNTGVYSWQSRSTITANSSVPGMVVPVVDGKVQFDNIKLPEVNNFSDARELFLKSKNIGFAIDLGIEAKPIKNLTLSGSLVDLGFIRWKSNLHNFIQDGTYDYKGVNIDITGNKDAGDVLLDTLKSVYDVKADSSEAFTTSLTGKLYAGVHYQLTKGVGFSALSRFQLVKNYIRPQFTFSLNLTHKQWFGYTLSYTIADGMFDNIGIGLVGKLGPLQLYLITDRIPLTWQQNTGSGFPYIPKYAKSINLRTGLNFVFGNRRKIKINKDIPFVDI